jgi:hypothetical protein
MIKVVILKNFLNVLSAKKQTKAGFIEKNINKFFDCK